MKVIFPLNCKSRNGNSDSGVSFQKYNDDSCRTDYASRAGVFHIAFCVLLLWDLFLTCIYLKDFVSFIRFRVQFGREKLLNVKLVALIVVGEVFVVGMVGYIVFVR